MNTKAVRREKLRELAKSVGGITKLADQLNKSQGQMSHLIGRHPVKNIGDRLAAQIEAAFNKPPDWLDLGHLEMEEDTSYPNKQQKNVVCSQVPLISWEEVQHFCQSGYKLQTIKDMVPTTINIGPGTFALCVRDDTMESPNGISIPNNSIIIVDPQMRARPNSLVVIKIAKDRGTTFKQLIRVDHKNYLKPLNRRYPILEFTSESEVLGVVRQLIIDFNLNAEVKKEQA
jgi:SOS-response transcriptional repressor LexA